MSVNEVVPKRPGMFEAIERKTDLPCPIGCALDAVGSVSRALPGQGYRRRIDDRAEQAKGRSGIERVRVGDPFVPVVHAVRVGINGVGRAVRGKPVRLQPGVRDDRERALELISPDIDRAARDLGIAVQVCGRGNVAIRTGIDAGRIALQVKVSGRGIHKERRIGKIACATRGQGSGATEVWHQTEVVVNCTAKRLVEIGNTIVSQLFQTPLPETAELPVSVQLFRDP